MNKKRKYENLTGYSKESLELFINDIRIEVLKDTIKAIIIQNTILKLNCKLSLLLHKNAISGN